MQPEGRRKVDTRLEVLNLGRLEPSVIRPVLSKAPDPIVLESSRHQLAARLSGNRCLVLVHFDFVSMESCD